MGRWLSVKAEGGRMEEEEEEDAVAPVGVNCRVFAGMQLTRRMLAGDPPTV